MFRLYFFWNKCCSPYWSQYVLTPILFAPIWITLFAFSLSLLRFFVFSLSLSVHRCFFFFKSLSIPLNECAWFCFLSITKNWNDLFIYLTVSLWSCMVSMNSKYYDFINYSSYSFVFNFAEFFVINLLTILIYVYLRYRTMATATPETKSTEPVNQTQKTADNISLCSSVSAISSCPDRHGFYGGFQFNDKPKEVLSPAQIVAREKKWLHMIQNWKDYMSKNYKKVRERCRKGKFVQISVFNETFFF